jgi:hypothetical protein
MTNGAIEHMSAKMVEHKVNLCPDAATYKGKAERFQSQQSEQSRQLPFPEPANWHVSNCSFAIFFKTISRMPPCSAHTAVSCSLRDELTSISAALGGGGPNIVIALSVAWACALLEKLRGGGYCESH